MRKYLLSPKLGHSIAVLWLFCSLHTALFSQALKFKHYTTEDGLPHNIGYDILQGKDGRIWIGTDDGLSVFDGTKFTTFRQGDGLMGPYIIPLSYNLYEDRMYVGAHKIGVNIVDNTDSIFQDHISKQLFDPLWFFSPYFAFFENGLIIGRELTQHKVSVLRFTNSVPDTDSLYVDGVYILNKEGQAEVIHFNIDTLEWTDKLVSILPKNPIDIQLWQKSSGEVYLTSELGVWQVMDDKELRRPFRDLPNDKAFYAIDEDSEGNLWVVGDHKLYKIKPDGEVLSFILPDQNFKTIQLRVISERKIYLLEEKRDQLISWNLQTQTWEDIYQEIEINTGVSFIEKDTEDNLWISTNGNGVYNVFDHEFENYSFEKLGESYSFINDIEESASGSLLFGTNGGLLIYEENKWVPWGSPEPFKPKTPKNSVIIRVLKSPQKKLYVYSKNGFHKILGKENFQPMLDNTQYYGEFSKDGRLVSALSKSYKKSIQPFLLFHRLPDFKVIDSLIIDHPENKNQGTLRDLVFFEDSGGSRWIAFRYGIFVQKGSNTEFLTKENGLPSNLITTIEEDNKGQIWFGTENGISVYNKKRSPQFSTPFSFPSIPVRHLVVDHAGILWMGTPQGLYSWDGSLLNYYNTELGLVSNDINSLHLDTKKQLWIGTSIGISRLDLNKNKYTASKPSLYIENIEVDDRQISLETKSDIAQKSVVSIRYGVITYVANKNLNFEYRLRDEDPWQSTMNRELTLSSLNAGVYNLQIRAKKSNSDWSEPIRWTFTIIRPWYKSFWVYLFGFALFTFLYIYMNNRRIRRIKEKEAEKTRINKQMAELELKALQAQINPHFIFNALNAIQSYSLEHDTIATNTYLTQFSTLMRMFLDASKSNRISLVKEIRMLTLYIEMEQLCYEDKFDYEILYAECADIEDVYVPSMLIQPFVENAIRHGLFHKKKRGMLKVSFRTLQDAILCNIEDNGIGRKASNEFKSGSLEHHVSRATQIVKERLEVQNLLEGSSIKIDIEDKYNERGNAEGTLVRIRIPIK